MAQTDFVVVAVVGRGDLQRAGAEFPLHMVIKDHGNRPAGERQGDADGVQMLVAFVLGMDGHGGVAQHGFRPGGGHHHRARAVGIGVADVVELAVGRVMLDLVVGQRRMAARAPVDDVIAFVDQPFLVQADKDLAYCLGQPLVHGEPLPVPVAGGTHPLQLIDDGAALFFLPGPDPLDEFLPAEVVAGQFLGG